MKCFSLFRQNFKRNLHRSRQGANAIINPVCGCMHWCPYNNDNHEKAKILRQVVQCPNHIKSMFSLKHFLFKVVKQPSTSHILKMLDISSLVQINHLIDKSEDIAS